MRCPGIGGYDNEAVQVLSGASPMAFTGDSGSSSSSMKLPGLMSLWRILW